MLLRSSSTPIMNSDVPETKRVLKINRTRSVSLNGTHHANFSQSQNEELALTISLSSEADHRELSTVAKKKLLFDTGHSIPPVQEVGPTLGLFSTTVLDSGGDGSCVVVGRSLIMGGISSGNGGGGIFSGSGGGGGGGGGSNGGDGGGSNGGDGSESFESADVYYQKMIDADPGNALLLGNYAMFLKEVRGDSTKAEEYCGRAILANPCDGNLLSMYGDLIWANQKDSERAQTYFDQAVKASPDDSYVLASYARFLWDADEEEEDKLETERSKVSSQPSFFKEAATTITIT